MMPIGQRECLLATPPQWTTTPAWDAVLDQAVIVRPGRNNAITKYILFRFIKPTTFHLKLLLPGLFVCERLVTAGVSQPHSLWHA